MLACPRTSIVAKVCFHHGCRMRQKRAIEAKQAKSLQSEVDLLGTETLAPINHRITPRSMTELSWSKVCATKVLFARDTTLLQIAKMCG